MSIATIEKSEVQGASIDSVLESINKYGSAHEAKYRQLVFDLVEGKTKLTPQNESIVYQTARTMDVLKKDVETYRARFNAAQDLKQAEALQPEINSLAKKHTEAVRAAEVYEKRLETMRKARWAKVNALADRRDSLESEQIGLQRPANEVMLSTYDFSIDEELAAKLQRLKELSGQLQLVNNDVNHYLCQMENRRNNHRLDNPSRSFTDEELHAIYPGDVPRNLSHQRHVLDQQLREVEKEIGEVKARQFDLVSLRWAPKG